MMFQKDIPPRCIYCKKGAPLGESKEQVMCLKKGIVSSDSSCRRFQYDPLKRVPSHPVQPDFSRFQDEDFTL